MQPRPARPEEADTLVALMHAAIDAQTTAVYDDAERTWWRDRITTTKLRQELEDHTVTFLVLEADDGRPIAMGCRQRDTIRYLYVHPQWSRQGIGTRMMAQLEADARRDGSTTLELDASRNAVPLYHRLGYHETGGSACGTVDPILCTRMRKTLV